VSVICVGGAGVQNKQLQISKRILPHNLANGRNTVVDDLPHHPEVKGSITASTGENGREKIEKK
jgi:hypothetical protein